MHVIHIQSQKQNINRHKIIENKCLINRYKIIENKCLKKTTEGWNGSVLENEEYLFPSYVPEVTCHSF